MTNQDNQIKEKKRFKVPHTFVIIFYIIILATILTYLVPAGIYDRVEDPNTGRTIVDVDSFKYVERTPVNPWGMVKAIPKGMVDAASIIFFIFILGGAFEMVQSTGAIDAIVVKFINKLKNKEKLVIPLLMFLFSVLGFTIGASEEMIAFVPITIMIARGFGFDNIVGVAIASTGAAIGFAGGMLNPFTTGVAQGIAQLPLYSGAVFRTVGYVIFYIIAVWYVMRYASKIKADPNKSVLHGVKTGDEVGESDELKEIKLTNRHKGVLVVFLIGLIIMIYGVMEYGWYINEISAIFLAIGIVSIFVGGKGTDDAAISFIKGAKDITMGALVVGLARTILIVMQEGQIMDSIIYSMAGMLEALPRQITAVGMFIINSVINFFIPSGSGQASTVMPIMTPLADVLGITRQTAALTVTYGDAFSNQIIPTSGALLGVLAVGKVPYDRWLKYNWKLVLYWTIAGSILVAIASTINLGPF
ncbi:YfcC family protein [Schnuerera ultunensis]|uniref:YfcC family protein n=1 Tax=Schnuerera ultunensis TaxID=45497 RepID=UPI00041ACAFC|nr:AbgT family transporter [Schnuerera ultunensis]